MTAPRIVLPAVTKPRIVAESLLASSPLPATSLKTAASTISTSVGVVHVTVALRFCRPSSSPVSPKKSPACLSLACSLAACVYVPAALAGYTEAYVPATASALRCGADYSDNSAASTTAGGLLAVALSVLSALALL